MRAPTSVSGTYRPPNSPSAPQRPRASASRRPGWTGVGRASDCGRSSRAALARLTKSATLKASLRGRPSRRSRAMVPSRPRRSTPLATSTPMAGMLSSASATLAASRPPARMIGHLAGDGGGQLRRRAAPGAARERAAGRVEHDPGGPGGQVRPGSFDGRGGGLGHRPRRHRPRTRRQVEHLPGRRARWRRIVAGASEPCSWSASRSRRRARSFASSRCDRR